MKRIEFLRSIFSSIAITAIPKNIHPVENQQYYFNEIFEIHKGNDRLVYPKKDCDIYKKIKELIGGNRILEERYFTAYLGYHYNLIPVKEKYTIDDFKPFVLSMQSYHHKRESFSEYDKGVFFRLFKETPNTMYFDVFLGDIKGQYHS